MNRILQQQPQELLSASVLCADIYSLILSCVLVTSAAA